ncbi:unnamed protein product [Mycena citricolor]|uniref:lipoyl(octanoyl) transferase n=1 Tax=Mycena citricolor TaxID=2018698 RepID=A0AAD2JUL8_9AGAR|nr:unnamed protein product [Mycena citricolor]
MSISALYHYFRVPVPYAQTLALQERIHAIQRSQRQASGGHKDILLLLQHRPVYTAGRRQTEDAIQDERTRLTRMGADFVRTARGGELTYHGPGQIVGYPLLDLSRPRPSQSTPMMIRDYVDRLQKILQSHILEAHGIMHAPSDNTGVFLDAHTKIASIGVQVRHRFTTHGVSLNITREPLAWFDEVVACGLVGVKAASVEGVLGKETSVEDEIPGLVRRFGVAMERDFQPMVLEQEEEIGKAIAELEAEAAALQGWPRTPL